MQTATLRYAELTVSPESHAISASCSLGLSGASLALALLEQSEDCVKLLTLEGRLEYVNCGGLRALELDTADQVLNSFWWHLWPEGGREQVRTHFNMARAGRESRFTAECPTVKGSPRAWLVDLKPLIAPAGPVVSILCTSRDITHHASMAA